MTYVLYKTETFPDGPIYGKTTEMLRSEYLWDLHEHIEHIHPPTETGLHWVSWDEKVGFYTSDISISHSVHPELNRVISYYIEKIKKVETSMTYDLHLHTLITGLEKDALLDDTLVASESVRWLKGYAAAHGKHTWWLWEEVATNCWNTQQIKKGHAEKLESQKVHYTIRPKQYPPPIDLSGTTTVDVTADRLGDIANRHIIREEDLYQAAELLGEAADLGLDWQNIVVSGLDFNTMNSPAIVIRNSPLYREIAAQQKRYRDVF